MAQYSMSTGKVTTGALAAAAVKSLVLLNPVTDKGRLIEAWLSFGSTASQTDIAFELYRTVTLGSPAGTTGVVIKYDPAEGPASWTGLTALSAEPTSVEVLTSGYLTTNGGLIVVQWPLGREPVGAAAGSRLGIRVVNDGTGTMTAVDCRATLVWDE
jgi:hypothetical protein